MDGSLARRVSAITGSSAAALASSSAAVGGAIAAELAGELVGHRRAVLGRDRSDEQRVAVRAGCRRARRRARREERAVLATGSRFVLRERGGEAPRGRWRHRSAAGTRSRRNLVELPRFINAN
jgi:hypothetical protein